MANIANYKPNSLNGNTISFADLLPLGKVWAAKTIDGSILNTTLKSSAIELGRYETLVFDVGSQYIPNPDTSFVQLWEFILGIPDDIFDTLGTDTERRRNILVKLAFMNLQTEQDYFDLANFLNLGITITNAGFTTTIDVLAVNQPEFPYTFPFTFGSQDEAIFKAIILKQKPAYQNVVFT